MATVHINNIRKSYGGLTVLHGLNIAVADGEFTALVGPSGCGKSTLLRMIAGLEEISGGTIEIDGKVVNNLPPKERDISMVFQSYALYPHMTVAQNMAFSLTLAGVGKSEIDRRVGAAAEVLALTALLQRYPKQLSGGQRQRVAMGRSMVRNPKVFLFDEPLSNLDAKLRVAMRAELKSLHQRLRTTTVYVTHDQVEAMTMADKIVVMNEGRIEQIGTPIDLYDHPANLFVAGFIGSPSMNMLPGTIKADSGTPVFYGPGGIRLALPAAFAITPGQSVIVGIRPEHLSLGLATGDFAAVVDVVEPMGSHTDVVLSLDGIKMTGILRERIPLAPGETVRVGIDTAKANLFDAGSGLALGGRSGAKLH